MGNRLEEERCIVCGEDLVFPFNDFRACSVCTPKLLKVRHDTRMQDKKKRGRAIFLNAKNYAISRTPLGYKAE